MMPLATHLVRAWVRVYTWRLPAPLCERRRSEIESDLWESVNDTDRLSFPGAELHIIVRLVAGIPADIAWRADQERWRTMMHRRVVIALTLGAAAAFAAWVVIATSTSLPDPPGPPTSGVGHAHVAPPPPPPPPPPPRLAKLKP